MTNDTDLTCQEMSQVLELDKTSDKVSETQIMRDLDQTSHHNTNTALSWRWLVITSHRGFSLVDARPLITSWLAHRPRERMFLQRNQTNHTWHTTAQTQQHQPQPASIHRVCIHILWSESISNRPYWGDTDVEKICRRSWVSTKVHTEIFNSFSQMFETWVCI